MLPQRQTNLSLSLSLSRSPLHFRQTNCTDRWKRQKVRPVATSINLIMLFAASFGSFSPRCSIVIVRVACMRTTLCCYRSAITKDFSGVVQTLATAREIWLRYSTLYRKKRASFRTNDLITCLPTEANILHVKCKITKDILQI